jgi:hypothetical protein
MTDPTGLEPVDNGGCPLGNSGCVAQDQPHWGPVTECNPSCGTTYDWQFLGGLERYADGSVSYYAWALDSAGNPLVGHCILNDEYGRQCGVLAETNFAPWNLIQGYFTRWANIIKACPSDPALCALVIGTRAATSILSIAVGSAVAGACVGSSGITCFVAVRGGTMAIHFITFTVANTGLENELLERGRQDGRIE